MTTDAGSTARLPRAICALLLLAFVTLCTLSGTSKSPSADENRYAGFGKYLLITGDTDSWLLLDQPPLSYVVTSAPFLLTDTPPASGEERAVKYHSKLGRDFLFRNTMSVDSVLLRGRAAVTAVGALALLLLMGVAWRIGGPWYAVAGGALFALDPNLIAHGRTMTSDVIGASFFFLGAVGWAWFLREASWKRAAIAGALVGVAMLAKVSGLLLVPGVAVATLIDVWRAGAGARAARFRAMFLRSAVAMVVAAVVVWGGYGFSVGKILPIGVPHLEQRLWLANWDGWKREALTTWTVPCPEYARLLMVIVRQSARGRTAFMAGELSETGFALFYPFTMLVKLPLGTIVLLLALSVSLFAKKLSRTEGALFAVAAVYLFFAMRSKVNVGIRHVFPALPLLYLLAGRVVVTWRSRAAVVAVTVCLAWNAVSVGAQYPHYLAYINEAAGGPSNGRNLLADSSLDWGQDLKGLGVWMDENGVDEVRLSYFGAIDPAEYGVAWRPIETPLDMMELTKAEIGVLNPGWVAISATNLAGVYPEKFGWMTWAQRFEPDDHIGHSILLYRFDR